MSMNRDDRRALHKKLKPVIKRVVELEKQIKAGVNVPQAENEIAIIMEGLSLVEMMAIEDYICGHNLL